MLVIHGSRHGGTAGIAPRMEPVRMLPGAKGILPHGDFRSWPDIEAWACEIAEVMASPTVPV